LITSLIILAWLVATIVALPLLVLGLQCFIALLPPRVPICGERRQVAILIPAHNEAAGIQRTLVGVQSQLGMGDRIVVVADNCNDATSSVARETGVEVVERFNTEKRGKGFALEAGVLYLERSPPDVVVILDADCEFDLGSVLSLVSTVQTTSRPCQARNLVRLPQNPGPEASVSTFAFLVKNWVRPRALQLLKLPVALNGTGMAFPWDLIREAPLGSNEIVEDLALGLHFARLGLGPVFCEDAHVWSDQPNDPQVAIQQRTRWEHGYLGSILRDVPRLLVDGLRTGRPVLILVALDLMVPPLALLAIVSVFVLVCMFLVAMLTENWGPFLLLLGAGLFAGLGISVAWFRFARNLIPAGVLLSIPGYVVGKLNIYKHFVTNRQKEWVRTERDGESSR
jgi:cellulose synthase/poly-beta-1,6-N-acetylglucosamine synthase-like glycosyltransferase